VRHDSSTNGCYQVIGPIIHECDSPLKVNTSVGTSSPDSRSACPAAQPCSRVSWLTGYRVAAMFYVFAAGMKKEEDLPAPYHGWVNVSDGESKSLEPWLISGRKPNPMPVDAAEDTQSLLRMCARSRVPKRRASDSSPPTALCLGRTIAT
jgi:hypothetical protein